MISKSMGGTRMEKLTCLSLHVASRCLHVGDYCGNSAEKSVHACRLCKKTVNCDPFTTGSGGQGRALMHNGPF